MTEYPVLEKILACWGEGLALDRADSPWPYKSQFDFYLRHGRLMEPRPLPKGVRRGRVGLCYRNAASLAMRDRRYRYCEGYAISLIPTEHAWVVDREGFAIDPTWPDLGSEYWGVAFQTDYLIRMLRTGVGYGLVDAYRSGYPLLTGEHSLEEALENGDAALEPRAATLLGLSRSGL